MELDYNLKFPKAGNGNEVMGMGGNISTTRIPTSHSTSRMTFPTISKIFPDPLRHDIYGFISFLVGFIAIIIYTAIHKHI